MNKIIITHGGQRQVVADDGSILAVVALFPGEGEGWQTLDGLPLAAHEIVDLLTPKPEPKTLVMFFDVSGFDRDMINALVAEISAQAESNDDHPDAEVGYKIILDGDLQYAAGAVAVGAGL